MRCVKTRGKKFCYILAVGSNPSVTMCEVRHERHNSGPRLRTEMLNTILETARDLKGRDHIQNVHFRPQTASNFRASKSKHLRLLEAV